MEFYDYETLCLPDEIWKDIKGYEGKYQISNFGRVKSCQRIIMHIFGNFKIPKPRTVKEKIRRPKLNKATGYLCVELNDGERGKSTTRTIHSLVAKTFIKNFRTRRRDKTVTINHKDGNKLNNNVDNLEIISIGDNVRHMFKNNMSSNCIRVIYKGKEYYSKSELMRTLYIGKRKLKRMIETGYVKEIINEESK